ncbi:MAG: hypothetical protein EOP54_14245, partial [Sphingobacteriales bacterium]
MPVIKNGTTTVPWSISNQLISLCVPAAAKVATLSNLSISSGTISPAFSAGTSIYTVNVAYNVTSVKLTPTTTDSFASTEIAGTPVPSGTESAAYSLNTGANTISAVVTAEDGTTKKTYTLTVTRAQAPQTITFAALPAKTYGDGNLSAGATASSGQAVTYASDNTAVATIDNTGSITIKGAGTANITASQAGNTNYLAATPVSQALTIAKGTLTYTADTTSRNYGAANPTFTGTITGFKYSDTQASATDGTMVFTSTANATSSLYDASLQRQRYAIYGSGLSSANYTFVQASTNDKALGLKRLPVTYTFRTENHVYDGKDNPSFGGFSATFTGIANGQTADQLIALNYSTTATAASGPGVYPILLTTVNRTTLGYNYDFTPAASNATALTITKANLTFTAQVATKKYGEANPAFTGTITGFVNNQTAANLTGTPVYNTTATTASGTGTYPIQLSGVSSNSYTFTAATANTAAFSITKNTLTYVADPVSRAFNTANPPLTGTVTGFLNGDTQNSATTGTLEFTTAVTPSTPVGTYAITGSGLSSANYDFAHSAANNSAFSIYLSTNGNLSNIALSAGILSPAFDPGTNNYTAEVSTGTTSITLTPSLSDINARVTVNGSEVPSGNPSVSIPLIIGANTIPVNVTAQDGSTTNPYNITVTRLPSDDAEVISITSRTGTMIPLPGYDYAYIDTVANNVTSVDITAIKREANATLSLPTINGEVPLTSGTPFNMPLNAGSNVVNVLVTAQDGVTKQYNNVHVVRRYSANNLLKTLAVAGYAISPAFSSAQKNYTLTVDNLSRSIDISGMVADSSATLVIDSYGGTSSLTLNQPLDVGENIIRTRVFAQSGAYTDYILTVTRAKSSDASLVDIGLNTPGTIDKPFNNDSLAYEYHVASTEGVLRIKPATNNSGATIRINGDAVDPNTGYNYSFKYFTVREPVVVVITSQDSSSVKTFTINAVRDFSSNAYLADLHFFDNDNVPLTPAFDKDVYSYTATIDDPTRGSTFIFQKSEDSRAEVRVNQVPQTYNSNAAVQLSSGVNNIAVSVRAQDGTMNLYTVKVTRALGTTAWLSGLVLSGNGGTYSNVINVIGDTVYSVKAPNSVTTLYVYAYANDIGADVKINGVKFNEQTSPAVPLELGDNQFDIVITSADGSTSKAYTLHVNRVPFADVTLASLKVNKGILSPVFSPATITYTVPMGSSDTLITITPIAVDPTAIITIGNDTISTDDPSSTQHLFTGTSNINVRVTSADGVTNRLYRVRPNVPSAPNANLYNIKLSKGSISPAFTATNNDYTATVNYAVSTIDISPLALEKGAIITVNGTTVDSAHTSAGINLNVGPNTATIIVKASESSPTTKTYTVTITRTYASADATLTTINLDNGFLDPEFNSSTDTYTAAVNNATTSVTVNTAAADTNAIVTINGVPAGAGQSVPLSVGGNDIIIVATAQNGSTTKTYTVTVNRAPISAVATLADLVVNGGIISPAFDAGTTVYNTSVSTGITSLYVSPYLTDPTATVTVNGETPDEVTGMVEVPLTTGNNTIITVVTAENGTTTQTYTLNITRAANIATTTFTLSPNSKLAGIGTGPAMKNYKTSVAANATSIMVKPRSDDPNATVTVNGTPVARSTFSNPIALTGPTTLISMEATAEDGITKMTYSIEVSKNGSNNADMEVELSSKSILYQTTGTAQVNYKTTVDAGTQSIMVKPRSDEANAVVTVNGTIVPRSTYSAPIALSGALTIINMRITAQDGVTTRSYTIAVTKTGSNNANMNFAISGKPALVPLSSGPAQENYQTSVAGTTSSVTITPSTEDANSTVVIAGETVANKTASSPILLTTPTTLVNMTVTAQDGITTRSYSVTIIKLGSNNANISIKLTPTSKLAGLNAGPAMYNYKTSVDAGTTILNVKATAEEPNATITIDSNPVSSGVAVPVTLSNSGVT